MFNEKMKILVFLYQLHTPRFRTHRRFHIETSDIYQAQTSDVMLCIALSTESLAFVSYDRIYEKMKQTWSKGSPDLGNKPGQREFPTLGTNPVKGNSRHWEQTRSKGIPDTGNKPGQREFPTSRTSPVEGNSRPLEQARSKGIPDL